jgi:multidrug efflux pump subunit AcrA (membrane-fusion protein)
VLSLACSSEEAPVEVVRPVISITVADNESFSASTLPGRAKAAQEANLAFEVSGKLIERPVDIGTVLKQGQLLVWTRVTSRTLSIERWPRRNRPVRSATAS